MLTIHIEDAQLEARILEKARTFGKSAQQFLNDIVLKELNEETTEKFPFEIPRLDYREHGYIYTPEFTEEELSLPDDPSIKPFSHITDSAKYVHDMRRKQRN